jgi:hypothetical protein
MPYSFSITLSSVLPLPFHFCLQSWVPSLPFVRFLSIFISFSPFCKRSVGSGQLLLVLASTVSLGFGSGRDPWPYFCSFQNLYVLLNGASSSNRGRIWLLLVSPLLLGCDSSGHSLTNWPSPPNTLSVQRQKIRVVLGFRLSSGAIIERWISPRVTSGYYLRTIIIIIVIIITVIMHVTSQ